MFNIVEYCGLTAVDVVTILFVYLNIENPWVCSHNHSCGPFCKTLIETNSIVCLTAEKG